MNDKLRKIYDDCRHYGALTYRTDFPTDNGYLTIIMFDYDNHIYTFKMLNGEILGMIKDWKEFFKMRKNVTERFFKCSECGTVLTAYKKSSRRTGANHIKHMYCHKCKEVHPFIQLSKYI